MKSQSASKIIRLSAAIVLVSGAFAPKSSSLSLPTSAFVAICLVLNATPTVRPNVIWIVSVFIAGITMLANVGVVAGQLPQDFLAWSVLAGVVLVSILRYRSRNADPVTDTMRGQRDDHDT
jgi:hypothetical protein